MKDKLQRTVSDVIKLKESDQLLSTFYYLLILF